jgi:hypothetical protein
MVLSKYSSLDECIGLLKVLEILIVVGCGKRLSSIHHKDLPGDEAGILASKPEHGLSDVNGLVEARNISSLWGLTLG